MAADLFAVNNGIHRHKLPAVGTDVHFPSAQEVTDGVVQWKKESEAKEVAPKKKETPAPVNTDPQPTELKLGDSYTTANGESLADVAQKSPALLAAAKTAITTITGPGTTPDDDAVASFAAQLLARKNSLNYGEALEDGCTLILPTADEVTSIANQIKAENDAQAVKDEQERQKQQQLKQQQEEQARQQRQQKEQADRDARTIQVDPNINVKKLVEKSKDPKMQHLLEEVEKDLGRTSIDNTVERAAELIIAANLELTNRKSKVGASSLVLPSDEEIKTGVDVIKQTVTDPKSKSDGNITRAEANDPVPPALTEAMKKAKVVAKQ
jgi:hypothetical protein